MAKPPSDKQLSYLKGLGYSLTPPRTSGEASEMIDGLKSGSPPEQVERNLHAYRQQRQQARMADVHTYLSGLSGMVEMAEGEFKLAGFRLSVERKLIDPAYLAYDKAFLPFDVALRLPQILAIDGLNSDEL